METKSFLKLVDAALKGDKKNAQMAVRMFASKVRDTDSLLYKQLTERLQSNVLRVADRNSRPLPVDSESRLGLVKVEDPVLLDKDPIFSEKSRSSFDQILLEREYSNELVIEGLEPTKSLIFQGPPGVGKTMSARWLAGKLGLPLLVLDLSTVMSSFLGKTGSNIRSVLEYAMSFPCVLLLDEFDCLWDFSSNKRRFSPDIKKEFGVRPDQIPDFLGLVGDSVDCIDGVPGLGPVKAKALFTDYNNLEEIYQNIDSIASLPVRGAKSLQKALQQYKDEAFHCRELATIVTRGGDSRAVDEAFITDPLSVLTPSSPKTEGIEAFFELCQFPVLMEQFLRKQMASYSESF